MTKGIQFSGGKDSLVVLYLMRAELSDVTVYFGNTGIVYPHMVKFVQDTCEKLGATLKMVAPPIPIDAFHKAYGLPADIVPVEASFPMQQCVKVKRQTLLQSSLSCCSAMLWRPLHDAMLADGIKTVYRGSKADDDHVGVADGHIDENGITYRSPIWAWSDADVFAYLREVGAELPAHYAEVNNSFDCIGCTAWLNHAGATERLKWTKKNYPEQWPALEKRLKFVRDTLDFERKSVAGAFDLIGAENGHV